MIGAFLFAVLLVLSASAEATPPDDHFADAERAHYAALCHARKDLDSCSDAVRWSPGDPALVVALADALMRAGRAEEAIRDYRRAEALDPHLRDLDAKIGAAEARLSVARHARKNLATERAGAGPPADKRYSNADPESRSH
ncbi:MAG TPA: hypothetical protein VHY75_02035 [Steroidobacteraceae bacterium]|jgi:predicted Zn-dependent protease|nr:hypothetical protein [Steroidobacteraceae bacterium]